MIYKIDHQQGPALLCSTENSPQYFVITYMGKEGLPGGMVVKNSSAEQETGAIPGSGRSLGGGNGSPLSCLENSMDREVWWAIVRGATKIQTQLKD